MARLRPEKERLWGRMSAHQMVCHLADAFDLVVSGRQTALVKVPLPRPVVKRMALWTPVQWPKGVPTVPEVEQGLGGTAPGEWGHDYQRLLEAFSNFRAMRDGWPRHAFFGEMSAADWMRWGYLHPDHHLRQFGV